MKNGIAQGAGSRRQYRRCLRWGRAALVGESPISGVATFWPSGGWSLCGAVQALSPSGALLADLARR
jgi:hypothetical protein